jgi:hypothetical protein
VHLEQNIKQNTDFYKGLKEIKMLEKTQKKKKSSKTKLSAASTKGKSFENTTTVSSEALIPGHDIPLRTIMLESEPIPQPQSQPRTENEPISLSSNSPSSNELNKEISQVLKETPKIIPPVVQDPKLRTIIEQGSKNLETTFSDHLNLLSGHLSPDTLNSTPLKQFPSSTIHSTLSTHTSPIKTTEMVTDSTFLVEHFSTLETEPSFDIPYDNLDHQKQPNHHLLTELIIEPKTPPMAIDIYQPPLTMDDIWIPSDRMTKLLEDLTRHFVTIDEPTLVFRSHLRMLRSKCHPKPSYTPPHIPTNSF